MTNNKQLTAEAAHALMQKHDPESYVAEILEPMKAKYDDITVTVSRAFIAALRDLMQAEMNMMRRAEPRNAECWTWGKCTIRDLASARGLEFEFGGDDDMPPDVTPRRRLVVVAANTRLDDTAAAIDAARGAQGESNG